MSTEPEQICARNDPKVQKARRNLKHLIIWRRWKFLLAPRTNEQQQGNLVQDDERRFEQLSDDQKFFKLCSDAGFRMVEKGQYFFTLDTEEGDRMQHLCRECTMLRCEKKSRAKEVIFPKQGELIFPIADGRIKALGGDQDLRTSTLVRHRPRGSH